MTRSAWSARAAPVLDGQRLLQQAGEQFLCRRPAGAAFGLWRRPGAAAGGLGDGLVEIGQCLRWLPARPCRLESAEQAGQAALPQAGSAAQARCARRTASGRSATTSGSSLLNEIQPPQEAAAQ